MIHTRPANSPKLRGAATRTLLLVLGLLGGACAALSPKQMERLHQTHWQLIAMQEEAQPLGGRILLRVAPKRQIFGQMNRSSYFGSYQGGSGGQFRVLNLAPIQGDGTGAPAADTIKYLSLMLQVERMRIDASGQLVLSSQGRELLRFDDSLRLRSAAPRQPASRLSTTH